MHWRGTHLATAVLAAGMACVGCGTGTATEQTAQPEFAVILPSSNSDYFEAVTEGALQAAKESSTSLTITNDASSVASQIAAVRNAIETDADAILIAPVGPEVDAILQSAKESGAVVVDVGGTGYSSDAADFLVQTDDCVLGIAAGQWTQGRMPGGSELWPSFDANFLLVLGDDGEYPRPTCRDSGWFEGVGIPATVLESSDAGQIPTGQFASIPFSIPCVVRYEGDREALQREITECVRAHPEVNAAYASTGTLARDAGEGLRLAGKTVGLDVMLATASGSSEGLDLASGSWVNAVARPRAAANGGFAVQSALTLLAGQQPETQGGKPFLDTGVDVCTDEPQSAVFVAIIRTIQECAKS